MYYLNSRYYDPELGRFINADDVSMLDITKITLNGINLFTYCLNNPVNEIDENGNFLWWLLIAVIVGAIVGATSNGVKAYNEGARGWGLFGSILGGAIMGGAMGGILALGGGIGAGVIGLSFTSGALISTGIGLAAGMASYSIEVSLRDDKIWNLNDFVNNGFIGILKGISTFSIGFFGGKKLGAFDKHIINPLLKGVKTLDYNITYSLSKILMGRKIFLTPLTELIAKILFVSGAATLSRYIIDKIFRK